MSDRLVTLYNELVNDEAQSDLVTQALDNIRTTVKLLDETAMLVDNHNQSIYYKIPDKTKLDPEGG